MFNPANSKEAPFSEIPSILASLSQEDLLTSHCSTATVQKIVTEILPPSSGLVFGKDARDLLIECCVEFITLISSEANDISEKESKKTIACDHITKALEQLGFGAYVQEIMEVANEHKEQLKVCRFLIFNLFQTVQLMILSEGSREESKQTRTERLIRRSTPRNAGRGVQRCCPETRVMLFYCFQRFVLVFSWSFSVAWMVWWRWDSAFCLGRLHDGLWLR